MHGDVRVHVDETRKRGERSQVDDGRACRHRTIATADGGDAVAVHHDDCVGHHACPIPQAAEADGGRLRAGGGDGERK